MQQHRDHVRLFLQGKVAAVQQMHLGVGKVSTERERPFRREDGIVLPPHRQRGRLVLPQVPSPRRVLLHIAAVIVEQVEQGGVALGVAQQLPGVLQHLQSNRPSVTHPEAEQESRGWQREYGA